MVDNDKYIHVQRSDAGIDYTIYDACSAKVLDGGVLDGAGASIQQRCCRHANAVSVACTCTVKSAKTCASKGADPQTGTKCENHCCIKL